MKRLLLAVVVIFCFAAPAAYAAKPPATVTGKLTGAKLPPKGKSRIPVWAVHLPDGLIAGGTTAAASGRFTLKLPPGNYAILTALIPARGRGAALFRVADFVTAKAGKRRTIKPTLKKRHKHKRRKAHAAAGEPAQLKWVDADYPVVWVHKWSTPAGDAELGVMQKGMQEMIITDLSAELGQPDCPGAVSAGDDLDKVLAEIKLQESPYFDSSQRLTTAKLVRPNSSVTGSMSRSGGLLTISATYQDQRPGKTRGGTVSVTGAEDSVFDLEHALVTKIVDLICKQTQPAYTGTFSGTWTSQLNDYKVTWTGNANHRADLGARQSTARRSRAARLRALRRPQRPRTRDPRRHPSRGRSVHGSRRGRLRSDARRSRGRELRPGRRREALVRPLHDDPRRRGDPLHRDRSGVQPDEPPVPAHGVQWVSTPKPLQSGDGLGLTGNTSADSSAGRLTSPGRSTSHR